MMIKITPPTRAHRAFKTLDKYLKLHDFGIVIIDIMKLHQIDESNIFGRYINELSSVENSDLIFFSDEGFHQTGNSKPNFVRYDSIKSVRLANEDRYKNIELFNSSELGEQGGSFQENDIVVIDEPDYIELIGLSDNVKNLHVKGCNLDKGTYDTYMMRDFFNSVIYDIHKNKE